MIQSIRRRLWRPIIAAVRTVGAGVGFLHVPGAFVVSLGAPVDQRGILREILTDRERVEERRLKPRKVAVFVGGDVRRGDPVAIHVPGRNGTRWLVIHVGREDDHVAQVAEVLRMLSGRVA